ncbi:MAG TPA: hypothetical protein GX713_01705 [Mollicutes bacterium]|nr:hypothetical protein [Mollicutes bacterium]
MLKKSLLKRLFLISSCLFILFILYLFPEKDSEIEVNKKHNPFEETSIYLIDSSSYVSRVSVVVNQKEKLEKIKEIISYLTINSKHSNYIKEGFKGVIPENTKLIDLDLKDGLLKLNFSKEFYNISLEDEEKMISAIIYSLTDIDGIEKITIFVEDAILHEMPNSKIKLSPTLDRSFGINKIYDLTNFKGSVSTTVYYLSRHKDYYYYVPVTMINNQKNDKIEIIINELTSKTMYQTNLISYLNRKDDLSYEVFDDYLVINLCSELYHDLNSSNLIESVIYSMNLSIKENYNVKSVMYTTNSRTLGVYYFD